MADVKQIYNIVNQAAKMVLGDTAITAVDTSSFISLGNAILNSEDNKNLDMFNKAIMDVVGKTIISNRVWRNNDKSGIIKDPFTYGAILRKYYVEVGDAKENPAYNISNTNFSATYAPIMKPTIKQYLFDKLSTFEYGVSVPDDLWKTGFHSETEMGVLIDAVFVSLDMKMELALVNLTRLTRAAYMARLINAGGVRAVNLLAEYNTATGQSLTAGKALMDKEFIRWSNMIIGMYTDRIEEPSRLFNNAGNIRHTPKSLQVLSVLSNYARASEVYLESDTYHDDLVKMPHYNKVAFWQGSGTSYAFNDVSAIKIKLDDSTTVEATGIVAFLHDIEALGVTLDQPRTKTQYYPHEEFTNYWEKGTRGYFNDLSENAIVFYIADNTSANTKINTAKF